MHAAISIAAATLVMVAMFAFAGLLAVYVAAVNAEWFFRSQSVRSLTGNSSRRTARIVYGIAGLAILAVSAYMALTSAW